jgi:hypothetical protein
LADGSEEELDYASLRLGAGGAAYCRVKGGRFDARLASAAWTALGERLRETADGLVLDAAGRSWPIAIPDAGA